MDSDTVRWSDLPKDLLTMIAKRLDTRTDVLRLRAVCSPWRSSLTSFPMKSPPFSVKLPFPIAPNDALHPKRRGYFALTESTIYYLEPRHQNPNAPTSSSKGWLVKVGEGKHGKMRVLDPFSKFPIDLPPKSFSNVLNLLNFGVSEVKKVYNLQFVDLPKNPATSFNELKSINVKKVVMASSPGWTDVTDDYAVMTIHTGGKLGYLKLGDKKWTAIDDGQQNSHYDDIEYHKGKFYAVDYRARVVVIDSSLKYREIVSPVLPRAYQYGGQFKHLVESFGDLFLVDRFLDVDQEIYYDYEAEDFVFKEGDPDHPIHFKVYKLNDEENEWVPVESLGDRALFVGNDSSFSVSARDFPGCKENCIYFTEIFFAEEKDDHPGYDAGMFDLEDGTVGPLSSFAGYSQILWPPPTWLSQKPCSS